MFKRIDTMMAMFKARPAKAVRLGEPADDHVAAWWDHRDRQAWEQDRTAQRADTADRAARAAAWAGLAEKEREAVIAWCDDLNAQGRLEDHPFFDQWLALRMEGYVGD